MRCSAIVFSTADNIHPECRRIGESCPSARHLVDDDADDASTAFRLFSRLSSLLSAASPPSSPPPPSASLGKK
ncbi:MAG: hypothetical protein WC483_04200 [Candidatus Paceibacterota bacterium]